METNKTETKFLSADGLNVYDDEIKVYIQKKVAATSIGGASGSGDLYERQDKKIEWNDDETVYTESWTENGIVYEKIYTQVSDTNYTIQLIIDGVKSGLWTTIFDEDNNTVMTTYTEQ